MNQQYLSLVYIIALFALLYFLMIRPQQKRQKQHQEMLRKIGVNDGVITIGGLLGNIVKIKDTTVVLRVADNVRIEVLKSAISQVTEPVESKKEDDKKE